MKSIAFFNNKGGVGKSTLTFHAGCALAEMGHKVLLMDLDPQSNLTLFGLAPSELERVWSDEEPFIDDYAAASNDTKKLALLLSQPRSIHFLLKPTEDGVSDLTDFAPPRRIGGGLDLIPGRLSLHMYEDKISGRWSDAYRGDPLAIRTISKIRRLCDEYGRSKKYDYVLIDTSPSLGIMNKVIISTADGVVVPCGPDLFSLYGIRNIGRALGRWQSEFEILESLLSTEKRASFPREFVRFLGFTIYNAKKYSGGKNEYDLAQADYNYAAEFPSTVTGIIPKRTWSAKKATIEAPIGGTAVMHTHNTLPRMAQKYQLPIWQIPSATNLEDEDVSTIRGNRAIYEATKDKYATFVADLLTRL